ATSCNLAQVGIDTVFLQNQFGCDSLVITETTFAQNDQTNLTATSCNLAQVGIDTVFLQNQFGCDSLVITETTLAPNDETFLTLATCDSQLAGTDTLFLQNQFGCDSLVITETIFSLANIDQTNLMATTCDPTQIGIDTVFLQNQMGCDSLVITEYVPAETVEAFDDNYSISTNDILEVDILENDNYDAVIFSTGALPDGLSLDEGMLSFQPQSNMSNEIIFDYMICDEICPDNCDVAQVIISINQEEDFIPDAISPNGDGKNEVWVIPMLSQYPKNKLMIINRWGQILYKASPYNNDWNGVTNNGAPLPEGTYYYSIIPNDGKTPTKNGTITIIR
ncbi:MAG TPA: gliding motility-associated C-terminal domain-containing protein, partial [Phaeodactylibacter sp.]|nr:gliding motility-associated C-terminal domain-containing protein [Phaeodactylibacter sp.]